MKVRFLSLAIISLFLLGCAAKQQQTGFRMGDRMQVGEFVYSVLESRWRAQLGDMFSQRVPQNRFLLVRISVTNSGGKSNPVPMLDLIDTNGTVYPEIQDGTGVEGWLGMLRSVEAAQTETGWILFDAPPSSYRLRLSNGGDPGTEQTLLIEIPFNMESMTDGVTSSLPAQP